MKTFILTAITSLIVSTAAFADVRFDDLSKFYLSDCGPHEGYVQQPDRGPVPPRILAPEDAAPWLKNRAWDVRPFKPCPPKASSSPTPPKKIKHQRARVPVPQK